MHALTKISFALTLCIFTNLQLNAQTKDGNIITKTVNTQPYNSVMVSGAMEVFLEKGTEGRIEVTADKKIQDKIIVESDGETLKISIKNPPTFYKTEKIKITVPFQEISKISLNGSGSIEGKNLIQNKSLAIDVNGSGNINLAIEASILDVQLNGSGDVEINGKATDVEVKTTGSGNFKGKELISENAQIYISGSGDSTIYVKNSLKARIEGSGSIFYGGNPASNNIKVMGSGKVKPI